MKCDQYWPARGTETYGLIQVSLLDTVELATYTVRTFALHKVWPCPGTRPQPGPCQDSSELSVLGTGERELGSGIQGLEVCECPVAARAVGGMSGNSASSSLSPPRVASESRESSGSGLSLRSPCPESTAGIPPSSRLSPIFSPEWLQ